MIRGLLEDRILVLPDKPDEQTKGGLIIPPSAQDNQSRGVVFMVGKGFADEPIELKVGDTVLYTKHAGNVVELDGVEYLQMRQNDVVMYQRNE